MGPQPMPPQGAAPAPAAEGAPKAGGAAQVLETSFAGLTKIMAAVQSKPDAMPPGFGENLGKSIEFLKLAVESLGGGAQKPQGPATSSPEQGSNPNARPAL